MKLKILYIILFFLTAFYKADGQSYVIDRSYTGAERIYRIQGEQGSLWTWQLADSTGTVIAQPQGSNFTEQDSQGSTIYGNQISINWQSPGLYTLSVVQQSGTSDCYATRELGQIRIYNPPTASITDTLDMICSGSDFQLEGEASFYQEINWQTSGDGTFSDASSLQTIYTPGTNDILNGSVWLTFRARGLSDLHEFWATDSIRLQIITISLITSSTRETQWGASDGTASVQIADGIAPYSIQWNDSLQQTTSTATNLSPGLYTVTVTDELGCSASDTIRVYAANRAPIAVDDSFDATCGSLAASLVDNDYDPDGDLLIINTIPVSAPQYGDLQINIDGSFVYTYPKRLLGTDSFTYEICDNDSTQSLCAQATVTINLLADADCDGIPDDVDIDSDNDGILNVDEGAPDLDSDGDGIPDYLDIDADNDGIVDNIEAQEEGNYISPSGIDTNQNGLDDIYEKSGTMGLTPTDTDGDGTPDYLDSDSDNDNVPDLIEGNDPDATGKAAALLSNSDQDGDGLDDAFDTYDGLMNYDNPDNYFGSNVALQDFDNDGIRDWRDTNDDGDAILTIYEDLNGNGDYSDDDLDDDGHPEYLDYLAPCTPQIPEGYSPNDDGINDFFFIYCLGNYPDAKLIIFDRWGTLIYEKEHYGNMDYWGTMAETWWYGKDTKGKKVDAGVYMYVLERGDGKKDKGFVMVSY